ncbi:MAG: SpoIIE family protein phosphatase [Thiovulaceae bacterium]|nr:SpoIIE family protein phosphatase [Sulfurimonadaceae bacterium]
MKRLRRFPITNKSDLIYAKIEIGHYFEDPHEREIYLYASMELGSNIIKHSGSNGELWLLEQNGFLSIVACDRGVGIGNIELALQEGYSTFIESSLGIGLSSLCKLDNYDLEVFSLTKHNLHGSVVFFGKKTQQKQTVCLSIPFDDNYNGDFVASKGRLIAFGDVAGHGQKAFSTALEVISFFNRHCHSILTIEDFFKSLHNNLLENDLRGCDLIIAAVDSNKVTVTGVGNITMWMKNNGEFISSSIRSGSVGTHYSKLTHQTFELTLSSPLIITTDGVSKDCFKNLSDTIKKDNIKASLCAALYFCGSLSDDASIIYFKAKDL